MAIGRIPTRFAAAATGWSNIRSWIRRLQLGRARLARRKDLGL